MGVLPGRLVRIGLSGTPQSLRVELFFHLTPLSSLSSIFSLCFRIILLTLAPAPSEFLGNVHIYPDLDLRYLNFQGPSGSVAARPRGAFVPRLHFFLSISVSVSPPVMTALGSTLRIPHTKFEWLSRTDEQLW